MKFGKTYRFIISVLIVGLIWMDVDAETKKRPNKIINQKDVTPANLERIFRHYDELLNSLSGGLTTEQSAALMRIINNYVSNLTQIVEGDSDFVKMTADTTVIDTIIVLAANDQAAIFYNKTTHALFLWADSEAVPGGYSSFIQIGKNSAGYFGFWSEGDLVINAGGDRVIFSEPVWAGETNGDGYTIIWNDTSRSTWYVTNGVTYIASTLPNKDIIFQAKVGGVTTDVVKIDGSTGQLQALAGLRTTGDFEIENSSTTIGKTGDHMQFIDTEAGNHTLSGLASRLRFDGGLARTVRHSKVEIDDATGPDSINVLLTNKQNGDAIGIVSLGKGDSNANYSLSANGSELEIKLGDVVMAFSSMSYNTCDSLIFVEPLLSSSNILLQFRGADGNWADLTALADIGYFGINVLYITDN